MKLEKVMVVLSDKDKLRLDEWAKATGFSGIRVYQGLIGRLIDTLPEPESKMDKLYKAVTNTNALAGANMVVTNVSYNRERKRLRATFVSNNSRNSYDCLFKGLNANFEEFFTHYYSTRDVSELIRANEERLAVLKWIEEVTS